MRWFLICVFIIGISGCKPKETVALSIGKVPVTSEEFEEAFIRSNFALDNKEGRKKFLEFFISAKLVLIEAERMGLDKDPRFLQNVQHYWEQALLKQAVDIKSKESVPAEFSDERSLRAYYEQHKENFSGKDFNEVRGQIKWILLRAEQSKAIDDWIALLRKKTDVKVDYKALRISQ